MVLFVYQKVSNLVHMMTQSWIPCGFHRPLLWYVNGAAAADDFQAIKTWWVGYVRKVLAYEFKIWWCLEHSDLPRQDLLVWFPMSFGVSWGLVNNMRKVKLHVREKLIKYLPLWRDYMPHDRTCIQTYVEIYLKSYNVQGPWFNHWLIRVWLLVGRSWQIPYIVIVGTALHKGNTDPYEVSVQSKG